MAEVIWIHYWTDDWILTEFFKNCLLLLVHFFTVIGKRTLICKFLSISKNKDLENWNSNIWRLWCREQVKIWRNNRTCLLFSGRLADVAIYREALSFDSIKSLANCESISSRNLILDWFISSYQLKGDINVEDKSKSSFCKKNTLSDLALFNHGATHDYIKFMCEKLGGQLPTLGM